MKKASEGRGAGTVPQNVHFEESDRPESSAVLPRRGKTNVLWKPMAEIHFAFSNKNIDRFIDRICRQS